MHTHVRERRFGLGWREEGQLSVTSCRPAVSSPYSALSDTLFPSGAQLSDTELYLSVPCTLTLSIMTLETLYYRKHNSPPPGSRALPVPAASAEMRKQLICVQIERLFTKHGNIARVCALFLQSEINQKYGANCMY